MAIITRDDLLNTIYELKKRVEEIPLPGKFKEPEKNDLWRAVLKAQLFCEAFRALVIDEDNPLELPNDEAGEDLWRCFEETQEAIKKIGH